MGDRKTFRVMTLALPLGSLGSMVSLLTYINEIMIGTTSSRIFHQPRDVYSTGAVGMLLHLNGKFIVGKLT